MGCKKLTYYQEEEVLGQNWKIFEGGLEKSAIRKKSALNYLSGGMLQPGRNYNSSDYRYGAFGEEKTDEISGNGNHISFTARGYDPRLVRRWNPDPVFRHNMSPYLYAANNPIIFEDPEGETEFYFNGKWVGTDGIDNNMLALVSSKKLKRQIVKSSYKYRCS